MHPVNRYLNRTLEPAYRLLFHSGQSRREPEAATGI